MLFAHASSHIEFIFFLSFTPNFVCLWKVDVYSFAMIFYYLLSGIPPLFESNAVKAAQLAALHGIRPSWPAKNRCDDYCLFPGLGDRELRV